MGGTGPGTTTNPNTGQVSSAPTLQGTSPMDTFAGSRAAAANSVQDTINNQGITGILQANPAYADAWTQFTNALAMNPTAPALQQETAPTAVGFSSDPYVDSTTTAAPDGVTQTIDENGIPHLGATDPAIAIAAQKAANDQAAAEAAAAAAAKAAEAQKPITETGTKIWPPGPEWAARDVHEWLAANPHHDQSVEVPDKGPIGTPGNSWYLPKGVPL